MYVNTWVCIINIYVLKIYIYKAKINTSCVMGPSSIHQCK